MQEKTNLYWYQKNQKQVIIVTTLTIVHLCIDIVTVKSVHDIPISIYKRNQQKKSLQRHRICMTDSNHDYIIEKSNTEKN